jgi:hypothetical protein
MTDLIQLFTDYSSYIGFYVYMAFFVWLINAFVAGYNGTNSNKDDFIQSILWPISIATLIGMVIKLITIKLNKE